MEKLIKTAKEYFTTDPPYSNVSCWEEKKSIMSQLLNEYTMLIIINMQ